jgi:hypothetical protein
MSLPPDSIYAAISAIMFVITLRHGWKQIQSRRWKTATGRILRARVEETSDSDGSSIVPRIEYSYKVDGREFRSDRVGFLTLGSQTRRPPNEGCAGFKRKRRWSCITTPKIRTKLFCGLVSRSRP